MQEKSLNKLLRQNRRIVKEHYPGLLPRDFIVLSELTRTLRLSVSLGEISRIDGKWYVTHAGLLKIAVRRGCLGIRTVLQERQSDPIAGRWVFKATVYTSRGSRGFAGYGDADPANVSSLVSGAEMRVAETRAVNRALRKAYGIGLCSVEELRGHSKTPNSSNGHGDFANQDPTNSSVNGQPRLWDRLCLLIRKYNLDAIAVKAYAAEFCGTETLSGASRDLVESFISHLSASAKENRDTLICKLNSFSGTQEVKS